MLDLQFISDNIDAIQENCANRGVQVDLEKLLQLATTRKELILEGDQLRSQQKETSAGIPKAKDNEEKQALIAKGKELRKQVAAIEAKSKRGGRTTPL